MQAQKKILTENLQGDIFIFRTFFFAAINTNVPERANILLEVADIKNKSFLGIPVCYKIHWIGELT